MIACGVALMAWNAATTNVWDDETNGYFLSRLPLSDLWRLMASNAHEDPPFYDVLLWGWIKVAKYDPFLLRLPSIVFWVLALAGIKRTGNLLTDGRSGLACAAVAAIMPVHWMFPAAMRWYSLFACLTMWNFSFFVPLIKTGTRGVTGAAGAAGYVLTGAGMWYVNYSAPAVFLSQGFVAVLALGLDWRKLAGLAARWALIGVLYLPWLPVFIRQMGHPVPPVTMKFVAASLYALWAGEVSTPQTWWISVPAGVMAVCGCVLIARHRRVTSSVAWMAVILLMLLIVKNAIWTKRLMIFSPFLATGLGVALSALPRDEVSGSYLRTRAAFLAAAALMLAGSLVNLFRRDGWLAYRWLMPVREVVGHTLESAPGTLLLTNSNSVAFFGHDSVGLNIASRMPELTAKMTVLPFHENVEAQTLQVIRQRLAGVGRAAYVHESSGTRFTAAAPWVREQMAMAGFELEAVENHAPASDEYLRFHPGGGENLAPEDRSRLVVARFKRRAGN